VPPAAVRTLRDLLYWQYAKIISGSAGIGKQQYPFIMERFAKLKKGEIAWDSIREYVKEREDPHECIYCELMAGVTLEHMFPRALNGPQDEKNAVWVCASCNASKGARRLYEHWTRQHGLRAAKYEVPRIAEGKYLKLLYEVLDRADLLDANERDLRARFCPRCDLNPLCHEEGSAGKLSPLCLDGVATIALQAA
jgi:hypothetical protein